MKCQPVLIVGESWHLPQVVARERSLVSGFLASVAVARAPAGEALGSVMGLSCSSRIWMRWT